MKISGETKMKSLRFDSREAEELKLQKNSVKTMSDEIWVFLMEPKSHFSVKPMKKEENKQLNTPNSNFTVKLMKI